MRVVIAPDKFKDCLTAAESGDAMARGVRLVWPDVEVDLVPMADGGEGTVDALVSNTRGRLLSADVTGPLGDPVRARFGLLGDGSTAAVEMATASGLALIEPGRRDPFRATTRGTGELILAAIEAGARRIILGIGGSATNDGGAGLAQALGFRLLDADGQELSPGGGPLARLDRIDASGRDPRLDGVEIQVACDVDNPLTGPRGASAVFGPQKFDPSRPATSERIGTLDENLSRLASVIRRDLGMDIAHVPGSGAAGGLGGGLLVFAGGKLVPGVELVIEAVELRRRLQGAILCLTGEGSLDAQTASGKTAVGVSRLARSLGIPTLALAGRIGDGADAVLDEGITAFFAICRGPSTLEEGLRNAATLLEHATAHAVRAFRAGVEIARRSSTGLNPAPHRS
jgi:glycerate kinase